MVGWGGMGRRSRANGVEEMVETWLGIEVIKGKVERGGRTTR